MRHHNRLGKLVLLVSLLLGIVVGLVNSPLLRIDQVMVRSSSPALGEEVRRALVLPADAGVFSYPLCRIAEQVQRCHRVETVEVRRQLPHGIIVKITERAPMAALRDPEGFTLVSREGICLYRQTDRPTLPVFTGLAAARPPLGSRVDQERWRWALDLVAGATKVGLRERVEGDFTRPHQITVQVGESWRANLGNVNSLARKVTILGRLAAQLQREGHTPRAIDVSVPESPAWTAG